MVGAVFCELLIQLLLLFRFFLLARFAGHRTVVADRNLHIAFSVLVGGGAKRVDEVVSIGQLQLRNLFPGSSGFRHIRETEP